jgi:hypothetical protein
MTKTARDILNEKYDALIAVANQMVADNERMIAETQKTIDMLMHLEPDEELNRPMARVFYGDPEEV